MKFRRAKEFSSYGFIVTRIREFDFFFREIRESSSMHIVVSYELLKLVRNEELEVRG